jgi:hypothetical protein
MERRISILPDGHVLLIEECCSLLCHEFHGTKERLWHVEIGLDDGIERSWDFGTCGSMSRILTFIKNHLPDMD